MNNEKLLKLPKQVEDITSQLESIVQQKADKTEITRLDGLVQEMANDIEIKQEDFISTMLKHTSKSKMSIVANDVATKNFNITYEINENENIMYNIAKNQFDDYIMLLLGRYGAKSVANNISSKENWTSRTGTWVDATSGQSSYYASVVGATMTKTFFGSGLELNFYGDTRGGIWEFVIDGDTQNKVTVSTYRATAGVVSALIFQQNENKQHTVVGTFKGDDPNNVPSNGAGNSRGWANYTDNQPTFKPTFNVYATTVTTTPIIEPLFGASNKDFAFSCRKTGTTNPYHFIPWHDVPSAFKIDEPKILVDGVEKTFTNFISVPCNEVKLIQNIYGKCPESTENLIKVTTCLTFKADTTINIDGKMEVITPVDIDWGYGLMCPVNKTFAKTLVSSFDNKFTAKSDGSNEYLAKEEDKCTSYLFLNDTYKDVALCMTIDNPQKSLRQGDINKPPKNQITFWQHRATNMNKLYNVAYNFTSLPVGEVFRFSGKFMIAKIPNVYNLFL